MCSAAPLVSAMTAPRLGESAQALADMLRATRTLRSLPLLVRVLHAVWEWSMWIYQRQDNIVNCSTLGHGTKSERDQNLCEMLFPNDFHVHRRRVPGGHTSQKEMHIGRFRCQKKASIARRGPRRVSIAERNARGQKMELL